MHIFANPVTYAYGQQGRRKHFMSGTATVAIYVTYKHNAINFVGGR